MNRIEAAENKLRLIVNVLLRWSKTMEHMMETEAVLAPFVLTFYPVVLGLISMVTDFENELYEVKYAFRDQTRDLEHAQEQTRSAQNEVLCLQRDNDSLRAAVRTTMPTPQLSDRVKFMACGLGMGDFNGSSKLAAIKQARQEMGCGLKEAKDAVEAFLSSLGREYYETRIRRFLENLEQSTAWNPGPFGLDLLANAKLSWVEKADAWQHYCDETLALSDVVKFVACGDGTKIHAIKQARQEKGLSLSDAKDAVEDFYRSAEFPEYRNKVVSFKSWHNPATNGEQIEALAHAWVKHLSVNQE